ncbi:hypothetical protein GOP47_0029106 [Adiantum capillus-veneris]|nr:hypothetical protein GOP47_0029106 [Adiantum capillus-veneris]
MAMTSCFSSSTLLYSPHQSRGPLCLNSSNQRVLTATCRRSSISIALRASAADGAQLTQNKDGDKEEEEKALQQRMQALANSMVLPANYFGQLPNDLRSDLKDAAFALANGPIQRECGELAGEKLLQLSQAWEKGDTQAATLATEELQYALPREPSLRNAIGKRLIGAGRRFAGTGNYAKGELQMIGKALTLAGQSMQSADVAQTTEELVMEATRVYKFGDLQVALTSQKCFIGSIIALGFGALSWGLAASVQNIPDSASQYANDNATVLATSLKGALLLLGYGCTVLSGFAVIGLLGLGFQLSTKSSTEK